ncbi:MAG: 3-deoxy-manno-octulosonate cytidylyltransferase [Bacteroidaceae bacterium]|nr:3-deoxy-manno-octulosonate cytidylyltransferase [Bacteroidaceae bacterium]
MKFICLIPARYASTRFPGKPLATLGGKYVIQHVYERALTCFDLVYVCTDDERIYQAVTDFGGKALMTSSAHRSGTERCNEAYGRLGFDADVIVNIQGDEPFIHPSQLEALKGCFTDSSIQIATLVKPYSETDGLQALQNPNTPKVVLDGQMNALYFSRSVVPYLRGVDPSQWLSSHQYYRHIGIYGYRADVLGEITKLSPGKLEVAESLEQLRWLENGYTIRVAETMVETIGIDTPDDLKRAELYLKTLKV